ncbi:neutral zinc metallopeptidase [Sporosarcina oncorhynchi]|uniref:Neutral zinc metallopeptidase n=1 Tax=Sporosarcina oncorhynchi TaxID=3056444 RepID=A0ABZ0L124_9BACL|nr:neutral zinc metallopeptidase [Sporosarcina sp. T2O-4]WOV86320.1 neutral zinc metallopeptidase [Sporosarcina sp. T2O-4]
MEWKGRRGSQNVEDRRGLSGKAVVGGGIGSIILVLVVLFMGGDPSDILSNVTSTPSNTEYVETEQDKELAEFVSVVLAETEDVWSTIFEKEGMVYREPTLVLFSGSVQSACGMAGAAVGPFYCPADEKLYIDLSFYDELQNKFQAPGDFAMAYVIAHEVGHHVQKLLGTSDEMAKIRNQVSEEEYNKYSVRLELQADYLAGVWAHHAQSIGILEEGDYEEALKAASAVGDDTIQKRARGYVVPESFTHGTSDQRKRWFSKGFKAGNLREGDTFNAVNL